MPTYSNPSSSSRAAKRPSGGTKSSTFPAPTSGSGTPMSMENPDGKNQRQARNMLMDNTQLSVLQNDLRIIGLYVNSRHLEMLAPSSGDSLYTSQACKLDPLQCNRNGIAVYKITKLMYNENENSFEKLVSVYSALNSFGGFVALILQSDGSSTQLYLATSTSGNSRIAGELLANNMHGQFPGCEINKLSEPEKNSLLDFCGMTGSISTSRTVRSLSMIPSRREDERQHDKEFSAQGYEIDLPRKQYELLYLLAINEGQVFTHGQLFERVWGYDADNNENTLYCQITKLRNSLSAIPGAPSYIKTKRGVGYVFETKPKQ